MYSPPPGQTLIDDSVPSGDGATDINDDRRGHRVEHLIEVADLLPVGHNEGSIGAIKRLLWRVGVLEAGEVLAPVLGGNRVVGDDVGAALLQAFR